MLKLLDNQCFTTAPADYDYNSTKTIAYSVVHCNSELYRLVEVHNDLSVQVSRYMSGLFKTIYTQEVFESLLSFKIIKFCEYPQILFKKEFNFEHILNCSEIKIENYHETLNELRSYDNISFKVFDGGLKCRLEVIGDKSLFNLLINKLNPYSKINCR